jgi:hypothetical protein
MTLAMYEVRIFNNDVEEISYQPFPEQKVKNPQKFLPGLLLS